MARLGSDLGSWIAVSGRFRGSQDHSARAVYGAAAPAGREHLVITFGRVLLYLEDQAALDSLADAVAAALGLASRAFGPIEDAFTTTERSSRHHLERSLRIP